MRRVAIVTGTGLYGLREGASKGSSDIRVDTPFGPQDVRVHEEGSHTLFYANRHGPGHRWPPHRLDPRRLVDALARCNVEAVVGVLNTGSLRPTIRAGDLVLPHDLIDFTGHPHHTFFDDDVVHIDFSTPYCPSTRESLLAALRKEAPVAGTVHERGVYVATRGPRFETPAETAHLAGLGDVVGMTGAGEAVLARERGLCYAAVAFVANPSAGVAGPKLDAAGIQAALAAAAPRIVAILDEAVARLDERGACACAEASRLGRIKKPA